MAWALPRLLRRARRRPRPHAVHAAAALPVPRRRHDPRPLLRARRGADEPPRPARLPAHRSSLGPPRRPGADRLRALAATTSSSSTGSRLTTIVVTPNGVDPAFRPGDGGPHDYVLAVGAVQPRKNQLAALEAAQEVGLPLVVVGPEKDAATSPPSCAKRGATMRGYVDDRRARRALPWRGLSRAGVALRGIRPAGARGDGERHAGRDGARRGARSRSSATRPSSFADGGLAEGIRDGARAIATRSSPPGSSARARSRGGRPPSERSRSTGRRSADERLRRRRLARPRRRARAIACRARAAGRRARRDREPSRLGRHRARRTYA